VPVTATAFIVPPERIADMHKVRWHSLSILAPLHHHSLFAA
jgi:hypothetical protein